jgi:hypothetical protein
MKNQKKYSKLLLFTLVASFLLQSAHRYEHFFLEPIQEICKHDNSNYSKKQITHAHEVVEQCKVCIFSVSYFIENSFQLFVSANFFGKEIFSIFKKNLNIRFFKGSLFALRAPPSTHYFI